MVEFTVQGIVRQERGTVLIKGKKYYSVIIAHGENNNHFLPIYFYGNLEERIRATEIKQGDQIMVEGELKSVVLETFNKKTNTEVSYIRLIPLVRDFEYIARETTGREISLPILNKLLALEEIGGKIK